MYRPAFRLQQARGPGCLLSRRIQKMFCRMGGAEQSFVLRGVEEASLRRAFAMCKPDASLPSAGAIRLEIITRCYREEAARIIELVRCATWTARYRSFSTAGSIAGRRPTLSRSLKCVTMHYINAQWTPHDFVLGVMNSLPGSRRPHISAPGTPQIANSGSQCRTSTRSTSSCLPDHPLISARLCIYPLW
jgi:hypothetical protein